MLRCRHARGGAVGSATATATATMATTTTAAATYSSASAASGATTKISSSKDNKKRNNGGANADAGGYRVLLPTRQLHLKRMTPTTRRQRSTKPANTGQRGQRAQGGEGELQGADMQMQKQPLDYSSLNAYNTLMKILYGKCDPAALLLRQQQEWGGGGGGNGSPLLSESNDDVGIQGAAAAGPQQCLSDLYLLFPPAHLVRSTTAASPAKTSHQEEKNKKENKGGRKREVEDEASSPLKATAHLQPLPDDLRGDIRLAGRFARSFLAQQKALWDEFLNPPTAATPTTTTIATTPTTATTATTTSAEKNEEDASAFDTDTPPSTLTNKQVFPPTPPPARAGRDYRSRKRERYFYKLRQRLAQHRTRENAAAILLNAMAAESSNPTNISTTTTGTLNRAGQAAESSSVNNTATVATESAPADAVFASSAVTVAASALVPRPAHMHGSALALLLTAAATASSSSASTTYHVTTTTPTPQDTLRRHYEQLFGPGGERLDAAAIPVAGGCPVGAYHSFTAMLTHNGAFYGTATATSGTESNRNNFINDDDVESSFFPSNGNTASDPVEDCFVAAMMATTGSRSLSGPRLAALRAIFRGQYRVHRHLYATPGNLPRGLRIVRTTNQAKEPTGGRDGGTTDDPSLDGLAVVLEPLGAWQRRCLDDACRFESFCLHRLNSGVLQALTVAVSRDHDAARHVRYIIERRAAQAAASTTAFKASLDDALDAEAAELTRALLRSHRQQKQQQEGGEEKVDAAIHAAIGRTVAAHCAARRPQLLAAHAHQQLLRDLQLCHTLQQQFPQLGLRLSRSKAASPATPLGELLLSPTAPSQPQPSSSSSSHAIHNSANRKSAENSGSGAAIEVVPIMDLFLQFRGLPTGLAVAGGTFRQSNMNSNHNTRSSSIPGAGVGALVAGSATAEALRELSLGSDDRVLKHLLQQLARARQQSEQMQALLHLRAEANGDDEDQPLPASKRQAATTREVGSHGEDKAMASGAVVGASVLPLYGQRLTPERILALLPPPPPTTTTMMTTDGVLEGVEVEEGADGDEDYLRDLNLSNSENVMQRIQRNKIHRNNNKSKRRPQAAVPALVQARADEWRRRTLRLERALHRHITQAAAATAASIAAATATQMEAATSSVAPARKFSGGQQHHGDVQSVAGAEGAVPLRTLLEASIKSKDVNKRHTSKGEGGGGSSSVSVASLSYRNVCMAVEAYTQQELQRCRTTATTNVETAHDADAAAALRALATGVWPTATSSTIDSAPATSSPSSMAQKNVASLMTVYKQQAMLLRRRAAADSASLRTTSVQTPLPRTQSRQPAADNGADEENEKDDEQRRVGAAMSAIASGRQSHIYDAAMTANIAATNRILSGRRRNK